ncbi:MAG: hypothetical protein OSB07_06175 [Dehalococcoidia bacterium]|jgi:hypothetical protein|nr:hypothetical protein [Dehalococcoidia bacterium]|tara:strand:+ start:2329 stop:2553 length:225 start_codon:yes stop_codon:yes gene_type:complete
MPEEKDWGSTEPEVIELKKVRASLATEEWRDARIYRHIDEYKLDYTLIATKISSGELHYYVPHTGAFEPLNVRG